MLRSNLAGIGPNLDFDSVSPLLVDPLSVVSITRCKPHYFVLTLANGSTVFHFSPEDDIPDSFSENIPPDIKISLLKLLHL